MTVASDGTYDVRVDPPTFMRHDEVNWCRFKDVVETTFHNVKAERGAE